MGHKLAGGGSGGGYRSGDIPGVELAKKSTVVGEREQVGGSVTEDGLDEVSAQLSVAVPV